MKKALKYVTVKIVTAVECDEHASESEILTVAKQNAINKLNSDFEENVESIHDNLLINGYIGPWQYETGEGGDHVVNDDQERICSLLNEDGHFSQSEIETNGRLIAAAPDLKEALIAVYNDIDLDKHGSSELNIKVQEAIQKAGE